MANRADDPDHKYQVERQRVKDSELSPADTEAILRFLAAFDENDLSEYVDLAEGRNGGGALALVARADSDIGVTHSRQSVDGKDDYWKAVNRLREMGFDIPYFEGQDGTHPDFLGLYESDGDQDDNQQALAKALEL